MYSAVLHPMLSNSFYFSSFFYLISSSSFTILRLPFPLSLLLSHLLSNCYYFSVFIFVSSSSFPRGHRARCKPHAHFITCFAAAATDHPLTQPLSITAPLFPSSYQSIMNIICVHKNTLLSLSLSYKLGYLFILSLTHTKKKE